MAIKNIYFISFMGFFSGWGRKGGERPSPGPSFGASKESNGELVLLRERKFREELSKFAGFSLDDEQFARARQELCGDKPFPALSGEELRFKAQEVGRALGWSPDLFPLAETEEGYQPLSDMYSLMGTRRKNFEESFVAHLGRPATSGDIALARVLWEGDADIQKKWSTLLGEEVTSYAKKVAQEVAQRNDGMQDFEEDYRQTGT